MTEEHLARIEPPTLEQLTPEQKAIYHEVSRGRPRVQGPFSVLLRNPPLAEAVNRAVEQIRTKGKLEKRLYELIVMIVARHASAAYAWTVHEKPARDAGIGADAIEAIRSGRTPAFTKSDEKAIYDAVSSLLKTNRIGDAAYQALLKEFGLDLTVDIVACAGMYCMIGAVINGFEVPTPNGEKPF
jgi:4-carboxymuconolactone decarboxylase